MPIRVQCECGHEVTVADNMAGKRGRCPECNAVVSIPGKPRHRRRGGVYGTVQPGPRTGGYGWLSGVAFLLSIIAFSALLLFLGMGIFAAVSAMQSPEAFRGPWGMLSGLSDTVRDHPLLMAVAFGFGGALIGCLSFLLIASVSQMLRLFISLDRSLAEISDHLARGRK